ncbi:type II CRISPR-associated endonuclease Cas1 [Corynebacterium auris]|uniref:type II CRISPR-associated endonuclease Cas1 n=1 Tax=Corynebacterium auris TaxID=44750 RepID=UPI0025B3E839|nr:type II CRISPR-associated endonuclease Cas1 [Corynebacterium auris]WJY69107.1 CRISPR-associated endonuclease Cas1 [Corynebacterium auris]
MSWRVLDFSAFEGELCYKRGHIVVRDSKDKEHAINLRDVAMITLGGKSKIATGLLLKLSTEGIPVLVADWKSIPVGALQSWSNHTRVGARQIAQAELSLPRRKSAWAALIRAKIRGQARVHGLLGNGLVEKRLLQLAKDVRSGDPDNKEGQAARLHWQHFAPQGAFTRQRKSGDNLNACLNYGYTVLRGFCIRSVFEAGLWPANGVFHHGRSNAFNLVDDLIEPFRPVVDYAVVTLPLDGEVNDPEVKKALVACSRQVFLKDGTTVSTALTRLAQSFGLYVEGDIPRLSVPEWSGTVELQGG